jgi:hypothetical protein
VHRHHHHHYQQQQQQEQQKQQQVVLRKLCSLLAERVLQAVAIWCFLPHVPVNFRFFKAFL